MAILDESSGPCPAFLATIGFADVATQIRLRSLKQGDWSPLAEPASKAIQEEQLHTQYLIGAIKAYVLSDDDAREVFEILSAIL